MPVRPLPRFNKSNVFFNFKRNKENFDLICLYQPFYLLRTQRREMSKYPKLYLQSLVNKQNGFKKNG